MLPIYAIASRGLAAQLKKLEGAATVIAVEGIKQVSKAPPSVEVGRGVRIGALPVGNPVEGLVSMKEAEHAYRANAAVFSTADDMLQSLLDAVGGKKD
ncbi:MAG TPA: flagellar basal body rod C-terminal domain-containing protein [Hyphomicrobium sp.]|nr:flagellar basal body rod C-terminal domain-containing protein [Hyphomicrobium sp.]HRO49872.1 flagellar basal body rod C-terminal domain-containing protein [Hyphomicrobium sp.]